MYILCQMKCGILVINRNVSSLRAWSDP